MNRFNRKTIDRHEREKKNCRPGVEQNPPMPHSVGRLFPAKIAGKSLNKNHPPAWQFHFFSALDKWNCYNLLKNFRWNCPSNKFFARWNCHAGDRRWKNFFRRAGGFLFLLFFAQPDTRRRAGPRPVTSCVPRAGRGAREGRALAERLGRGCLHGQAVTQP